MNHVDNPFESPSILSLCPGVCGLERGLIRAIGRINVIAYVEIEAFIIANLVAAMEKGFLAPVPIWSDIKTFNAKPFRNKVHGIIGGYPCQPFSKTGARKGTNDTRHLYPYISGIIEATGPVWCWFENVEDHLTMGYSEVSTDLRNMGYAVEAGLYSAEERGAPHERDRLFILAIKKEFLANASHNRCEGFRNIISKFSQRLRQYIVRDFVWPALRGQKQNPSEPPRIIKSGMGCAAHGYDFTTDLLRAYGNSVVEQTAEIAFLDLLNKHGLL